ncbi:Arm DNA-binding domain-containing protein [Cupriavidus numazuensis]|uniref:Arm DNA-binding domain-containing protein n=1 Tax=Cupriavidus numazuensis TaxID=221992 RepID=UPI0031408833
MVGRTPPLTDAECKQLRYGEKAGNRIRDRGGLHLEVLPSSSKRWRLGYDRPGSKPKTPAPVSPGYAIR